MPVGVSILKPGERAPRYYAWGHPTNNNCTFAEGCQRLKEVWYGAEPLLFQYGKFDVEVAVERMGVKMPTWDRIHDTLFLLFLHEPHEELDLKTSAHRLLSMAPEERDAVVDWLKDAVRARLFKPEPGVQLKAYISEAPGDLVGKYANGDTLRTRRLFEFLYPIISREGMLPAYERNRKLMPILLRNEREGVRTDLPLLTADIGAYTKCLETADHWLRKRLRTPDLNVSSNDEFADALEKCRLVDDDAWVITPGGKRSVSKVNLTPAMINDKQVGHVYGYRNKLSTCLGTFMRPWERVASRTGGTIHTDWSQTRNTDRKAGAATGRMSSSPNFQNIPTSFEGKDGLVHPKFIRSLLPLPLMRKYLVPDSPKHLWGKCDYSQQELRLLDHFTNGSLGYNKNPKLDVHTIVTQACVDAGLRFSRNDIKRHVVFKKIYGGGEPAICDGLGCDRGTAKKIINAMLKVLPGYAELDKDIKKRGKDGECVVTWGGRLYYAEPPRYVEKFGRMADFSYKLTNYLIQGSAADVTTEAIIRYDAHPKREARFLLSVHDELDISAPAKRIKQELAILAECMESIEVSVPMRVDPAFGPRWSELQEAH